MVLDKAGENCPPKQLLKSSRQEKVEVEKPTPKEHPERKPFVRIDGDVVHLHVSLVLVVAAQNKICSLEGGSLRGGMDVVALVLKPFQAVLAALHYHCRRPEGGDRLLFAMMRRRKSRHAKHS
jgi:hypothetical protein